MMVSGLEAGIVIIAVFCFGIFYGGQVYGIHIMEKDAVTRGHGLYCPNTGDFAWVGECNLNTKQGE